MFRLLQNGSFAVSQQKHRGFFSDLYHESLVSLLETKLTKRGVSVRWDPTTVLPLKQLTGEEAGSPNSALAATKTLLRTSVPIHRDCIHLSLSPVLEAGTRSGRKLPPGPKQSLYSPFIVMRMRVQFNHRLYTTHQKPDLVGSFPGAWWHVCSLEHKWNLSVSGALPHVWHPNKMLVKANWDVSQFRHLNSLFWLQVQPLRPQSLTYCSNNMCRCS